MLVTAKQDTVLKLKLDQSSNLDGSQKILLEKETQLFLDQVDTKQGHLVATVYIYEPHFEIIEANTENSQDSDNSLTWDTVEWNDFNAKVSKYFTVREVTNGESQRIPTDNKIKQNIFTLAKELDKVREAWGSPIIVTSWYRPSNVNRAIGGATNSQHISGRAADIKPQKGDLFKFQSWLDNGLWSSKALGYGAKKGFVHVDLRSGKIRWNY